MRNILYKMEGTQIVIGTYVFKERGMSGVLLQDMSNYAETMKVGDEVFQVVEEPASPEGGLPVLFEYINTNLNYSKEEKENNIQGKVFISFIVQKDGSLSDFEILKGIGGGCEQEALRVLQDQNSPKWKPGRQRGKAVKQRMSIPINFSLSNSIETSTVSSAAVTPEPLASIEYSMDIKNQRLTQNGELYMTGVIKDRDGNPLPGVNIVLKDTNTGTITDINGNYKIKLLDKKGSLICSFVGFKTQHVVFAF